MKMSKKPDNPNTKQTTETRIAIFKGKGIRKTLHNNEWVPPRLGRVEPSKQSALGLSPRAIRTDSLPCFDLNRKRGFLVLTPDFE
jgi:hypothetical protein